MLLVRNVEIIKLMLILGQVRLSIGWLWRAELEPHADARNREKAPLPFISIILDPAFYHEVHLIQIFYNCATCSWKLTGQPLEIIRQQRHNLLIQSSVLCCRGQVDITHSRLNLLLCQAPQVLSQSVLVICKWWVVRYTGIGQW